MKRLPLLLIVGISAVALLLLIPFMLLQWILGGKDPFGNYVRASNSICELKN